MTTELGPLPKFQPPANGWDAALLVYTADQMAAERERCYALGVAAERERAARVCDDEARIRTEAGNAHPEDSDSRGRCFAAARAAINCANGVRGGEVVGPNCCAGIGQAEG